MTGQPVFLQLAYGANILILGPVCYAMWQGNGVVSVFQGTVTENQGLRQLVGSLWAAILLASIAGLLAPRFFAPILLVQIFYKALWLMTFVAPLVAAGKPWPTGISICFALIVLSYPVLFWLGYMKVV